MPLTKVGFWENFILLIITTFIIVVTCVNIGYYRGILNNQNGPNNGVSIRTAQAAIGLNGFLLALSLFYFIYKIYLIVTIWNGVDLRTEYGLTKIFDPVEVKPEKYLSKKSLDKYVEDESFRKFVNKKIEKNLGETEATKFKDAYQAAVLAQNPSLVMGRGKPGTFSASGRNPNLQVLAAK